MSFTNELAGFDAIQDRTISEVILENFVSFYDWGLLNKGGYVNVSKPFSGMHSASKHLFKPVNYNGYSLGQVWQTSRQKWVWETGINKTTQPIDISGIYVGSSFLPYTYNSSSGHYVGASGYRLDFENGMLFFNNGVSSSTQISMNYSYKWVDVSRADGFDFFRKIQTLSFNDEDNFITTSGDYAILGNKRVQLPALLIEAPDNMYNSPVQLGGGQYVNSDVLVYSIGENYTTSKNLLDYVLYQNDRDIRLYDVNGVYRNRQLPTTHNGDLINKEYSYPYILENNFYGNCQISKTRIEKPVQLSDSLFIGTGRFSTKIEMINLP